MGRKKDWWRDSEDGWDSKGVRDFFDESKRYYLAGDIETAVEILEWGKRYSLEAGSGGGVKSFQAMIDKLRDE